MKRSTIMSKQCFLVTVLVVTFPGLMTFDKGTSGTTFAHPFQKHFSFQENSLASLTFRTVSCSTIINQRVRIIYKNCFHYECKPFL